MPANSPGAFPKDKIRDNLFSLNTFPSHDIRASSTHLYLYDFILGTWYTDMRINMGPTVRSGAVLKPC